ncbi:hypothetical protein J6590_055423 [Homalodisca vitripennis]|nr:hypothetical protein J6590_055423 [Homalodisca vitripennis]
MVLDRQLLHSSTLSAGSAEGWRDGDDSQISVLPGDILGCGLQLDPASYASLMSQHQTSKISRRVSRTNQMPLRVTC